MLVNALSWAGHGFAGTCNKSLVRFHYMYFLGLCTQLKPHPFFFACTFGGSAKEATSLFSYIPFPGGGGGGGDKKKKEKKATPLFSYILLLGWKKTPKKKKKKRKKSFFSLKKKKKKEKKKKKKPNHFSVTYIFLD